MLAAAQTSLPSIWKSTADVPGFRSHPMGLGVSHNAVSPLDTRMVISVPRRSWLLIVPLLGAVFCYWRALHGDFVLDDVDSVVRDPTALDPHASFGAIVPSFFSVGSALGRSFTAWTFALNHAWGGLDPFGYRLANLGLHLLVVLLVFLYVWNLLSRAQARDPAGSSLVIAGIFALHPLHSQTVNYVVQRSELLASAAYLGALMLVLRASAAKLHAALLWLSLALTVFVLGLSAKVIVVTMPYAYVLQALIISDARPNAVRVGWRRHVLLAAPFAVLGIMKLLAMVHIIQVQQAAGNAVGVLPLALPMSSVTTDHSVRALAISPWTYFMTQWKVILVYVRLFFWPSGQCFDWLYPISTRLDLGAVVAGLLLLSGLGLAGFLARRARSLESPSSGTARVAAFGLLWFLLVLSPSSSFVPLVDALVEHRAYLASVGLLVAVIAAARHWCARLSSRIVAVAVAAIWIGLGFALYRRCAVWENATALWSDTLAKRPNNPRAHFALAVIHQGRGDMAAAIREHELALRLIGDGNTQIRLAMMQGLAAALVDSGRVGGAIELLAKGLAIEPRDPGTLASMAAAQLRAGNLPESARVAEAALAVNSRHSLALLTLGEVNLLQQDMPAAIQYLSRAVDVEPNEPVRLLEYGRALSQLGRRDDACQAWGRVMRSPDSTAEDRRGATQLLTAMRCVH